MGVPKLVPSWQLDIGQLALLIRRPGQDFLNQNRMLVTETRSQEALASPLLCGLTETTDEASGRSPSWRVLGRGDVFRRGPD